MFRLARRSCLGLFLFFGINAAAAPLPKGVRTPRRVATYVIVRPADLNAHGVLARLGPGLGVTVDGDDAPSGRSNVRVTTGGLIELAGTVPAAALGARLAQSTELYNVEDGSVVGTGLAGALVAVARRTGGGRVQCETVGPIRARVAVDAGSLTAEPGEWVYPMAAAPIFAVSEAVNLIAKPSEHVVARLDPWTRVRVLDETDATTTANTAIHVTTYGPFALTGWLPRVRLVRDGDAPPIDAAAPRSGLTPTHEALIDTAVFADRSGHHAIGTLHGGALVTMGIETDGPRVKIMTHGDVIVEAWVVMGSLRRLEPEIWSDR